MTFIRPGWFVLALLLGLALWHWPLPSRVLRALRVTLLVLVMLALTGLAVRLPSRDGTVVVLCDRSRSMPPETDADHREAIKLVQQQMGSGDRLAVVSFGERTAVEQPPQESAFSEFVVDIGADQSDLHAGLQSAINLIPADAPGRVLVISDGRYTGSDPRRAIFRAAAEGIGIDYRVLERGSAGDVAIDRVEAPGEAGQEEAFTITAWVRAPVAQEIAYKLQRDGRTIAQGTKTAAAGLTPLIFRDRAGSAGAHRYQLKVDPAKDDPVSDNNRATFLMGVRGTRPLLCIGNAGSQVPELLRKGGIRVEHLTPDRVDWSLDVLAGYAGVLIENVPANDVTPNGMETLAAWVPSTGAGLMMTGGRAGYGPGGYFRSPLEPIMPVSMELRREHRKLRLAISIAMDRSGSMSMMAGGGKTKMDLANIGAAQVLDMLSDMDELGVIAVDSQAHTIAKLGPAGDNPGMRSRILSIRSKGGGIFVYEALSAAADMLTHATAGTRHIILFADAADAEQPGDYRDLLQHCRDAGITCSVIGLGTPTDVDAGFLQDVARRGGGRCYFTQDPQELPRLFAQDTVVVARSAFIDETTPFHFTGGFMALAGRLPPDPAPLGGYNLCYIRPEAQLAAVTEDEYRAPVVAAWQSGLGRVLCYTGELDGKFTGPLANWPAMGDFATSMARWTLGDAQDLPHDVMLTQELDGGVTRVRLHLDPRRRRRDIGALPQLQVLRGLAGDKPQSEQVTLQWQDTDTLGADLPLRGDQTVLATLEYGGGRTSLPPVCLPYSPEFKPQDGRRGSEVLQQLAEVTGGQQRLELGAIWNDLPRRPRLVELSPFLLIAALLVFLLEVLERRTGVLGGQRLRQAPEPAPAAKRPGVKLKKTARSATPKPAATSGPATERATAPASSAPEEEPKKTMFDALRQARSRAQKRNR